MITASKRAVAVTTTLSIGALAGASMSTSMQEMTMQPNITMPALGAITLANGRVVTPDHVLLVEEDRSGPHRATQVQTFNTWLDDQPVVIRHRVPFYASCRVLAEWGILGLAAFYRPDGIAAFVVDIAAGAKLSVAETGSGPKVIKHVPFEIGFVTTGRNSSPDSEVATKRTTAAGDQNSEQLEEVLS